jgi:hypothetical protein
MTEIRDKILDYASRVKTTDPDALVLGPEEWGWSGYFYSGYDQQYGSQHGWSSFPDRTANGGSDYLPWLLDQFHERATNTNQRLLDYFTVHFYPQGGEFSSDTSTATQLLRNRSTRSLWDTNYLDASWINDKVYLIPRLKNWAARYYSGTKVGITEYNWGAEDHINGATAQADIFGIFGREALDLATRWTTPATGAPAYNAIKMYRNYDGHRSTFGDLAIKASAPNPDAVSVFAAIRSTDGAMTVMVINKQLGAGPSVSVSLTNFRAGGIARPWQMTSSNSITRLADVALAGATLATTVPPQSITLFVLPTAAIPNSPELRAGTVSATNSFDFWVNGQVGQSYVLQSTTNFLAWISVQTNTMPGNTSHVVLPVNKNQTTFYRLKQQD